MYYTSTYVRLSFSLNVSYQYKNLVPIFFSCHFCDNPIRNSISVFRGLCTQQWIASHRKMNLIFNQDIKSLFWKRYQTCIKRGLHLVLFFPSRLSKSSVLSHPFQLGPLIDQMISMPYKQLLLIHNHNLMFAANSLYTDGPSNSALCKVSWLNIFLYGH